MNSYHQQLEQILKELVDQIDGYYPGHNQYIQVAIQAINTLIREEIIGEDELSHSIPLGMPESIYTAHQARDGLRAEQRQLLEDKEQQ